MLALWRIALIAVLFAFITSNPTIGIAEEQKHKEVDKECAFVLEQISKPLAGLVSFEKVYSEDDWCVAGSVGIKQPISDGYTNQYFSSQMRWRSSDLSKSIVSGKFPTALEVKLSGFRYYLVYDDNEVFSYLNQEMARLNKIDGSISLVWNENTKEFQLKHFNVDFGELGRFDGSLEAILDVDHLPLNLSAIPAEKRKRTAIKDLDVEIENHGFLQTYLLHLAGPNMLNDYLSLHPEKSVKQAVSDMKNIAKVAIYAAPSVIATKVMKQDLVRLIDAMPHPNGKISFSFEAEKAMTIQDFTEISLSKLHDVIENHGINHDFGYSN